MQIERCDHTRKCKVRARHGQNGDFLRVPIIFLRDEIHIHQSSRNQLAGIRHVAVLYNLRIRRQAQFHRLG